MRKILDIVHVFNMVKPIFITQPIDNDPMMGREGFTDKIDNEIRSHSGELHAVVNSPGGDIFKAAQISRSLNEYQGATKATVVGIAASAAALLVIDFDFVEADDNARFMLHKAHVPGKKLSELDSKQREEIEVFNENARKKLIAKGKSKGIDNEKLVNDIFLNEKSGDFYFSAIEAKTKLGLVDEVTKVSRKDGKPFVEKIAASLEGAKILYETYITNKNMGIFGNKNKPMIARTEALSDGRVIVFNSTLEILAKGDKICLIGSNEALKGKITLKNGIVAEIDENNEVLNVEENDVSNQIPEEVQAIFDQLAEKLASFEERLKALEGNKDEEPEATKHDDEEDKINDLSKKVEAISKNLNNVVSALGTNKLTTDFILPKFESKNEQLQMTLDPELERVIGLREAINNKAKDN